MVRSLSHGLVAFCGDRRSFKVREPRIFMRRRLRHHVSIRSGCLATRSHSNMSTRRTALRLGTGALVAGAAALTWRAWDQGVFSAGQGPAFEAWNTWNADAPGSELQLVHAAILAANPHNTQPWRFRVGARRIDVFADPARNIGTIDPFRREMHIGLGCALENLLQAAAAIGFQANPIMFPRPADPGHIATIALAPAARVAAPLHGMIA